VSREALRTDPFAVGDVVTPAVLIGVLGYAIGNYARVGMAYILRTVPG
jgi:uncharacterized membrane protein